ncbi:MAG: response regulator [Pseudomonadota bacterium]
MPDILIVEDQRVFLQVFRAVLPRDFTLHVAMDAATGWKHYLQHAPDIAFIDVQMEGIDGHTLAASIRALDGNAFTVMVTANGDAATLARARANEVRGFVTKPYSKKKIDACIALFLAERDGIVAPGSRINGA